MTEAKYTPEEIIAKLQAHPKFGSQIKPITKHQSAIISSGLEPAVVIAGAGSGKTETTVSYTHLTLPTNREV